MRDMELVRSILLQAERADPVALRHRTMRVEGYDEATVARHVQLMEEAGLLEASILDLREHSGAVSAKVLRITWEGYDFLDAARNETVWNKVKADLREKGMSASFDMLKALLTKGAAAAAGLLT